jgi:hypothetical protein
VRIYDGAARELDITQHDGLTRLGESGSPSRTAVVLRPGMPDEGKVPIQWGNWCGVRHGTHIVRVTLGSATLTAGDGPAESGFSGEPRCDDPASASIIDVGEVGTAWGPP